MKIDEMVCCSWHKPRNAVVLLKSGEIVPGCVLAMIPDGPKKEHMMFSGGMCDPCARRFVSHLGPEAEGIIGK